MARRAEALTSFLPISFVMMLMLLIPFTSGLVQEQKTWCVAKPSSSQATLWENLNYACSQVDCGIIREGCACFKPDNLMSHASIAMNLYYQANGKNSWNCFFKNSALIATTDPSFGDCTYAHND
ncbi:glucan endo-1,3-beta-D-glucosidase-like [Asparagus officinalis]|uniref:glucan endo-1,3-beta-D-glucosidase-like n=1 Tax=Asparagus officinalis TaxID=4686 RepID=UPI00098DF9FB|nr:glucan endo-1,3-beta-D-glucosidase-like [Asparagus officinalis]